MVTTANKAEKRYKTAQSLEPVALELTPKKGGRQTKSKVEAGVQQILDGAAPYAAVVLRDHVRKVRGVKSLKPSVQRACEYIIDHAIGKARQKIEHSGGILTYGDIAKSAETLDKKPRPILAEVMEIAHKHQEREALVGNVEEPGEVKGDKNTLVDETKETEPDHEQGP